MVQTCRVEDLGALLDAHDCAAGHCARPTHTQAVRVVPVDVATAAAEIRMLNGVRDLLVERGLAMLETDPTPRFEAVDAEAMSWAVRYESAFAPGTVAGKTAVDPGERRRGLFATLRRLW